MANPREEIGRKSSEGGRANPDQASPAAVQSYLEGIDYPASRDDLLARAEQNDAPSDVINVLEHLPDERYGSPVDVSREVGRFE